MLLYLIRHGRTDLNDQNIISGHLDPPLNAKGLKQVDKLAEYLKDVRFSEGYTSALLRATHTAERVLQYHPEARLHIEPRLVDRYMGTLEGQVWREGLLDPPDAETIQALAKRLQDWLLDLLNKHTLPSSPLYPSSPLFVSSPTSSNSSNTPILCLPLSSPAAIPLSRLWVPSPVPPSPPLRPASTPAIPDIRTHKLPHEYADEETKVLVVTHQECLSTLLILLVQNDLIDLHIPEHVHLRTEQWCGNTGLAILRVWWEMDMGSGNGEHDGRVRGRLECWAEEGHLGEEEVFEVEERGA